MRTKARRTHSRHSPRRRAADTETKRWIRSEADEVAVRNGCRFEERLGDHVVEFFETQLIQTVGQWAGLPLKLMDWQRDDVIMPLFGWLNAQGLRRYRIAYIEIPKKNGKSTMCSGLGLYLLAADGEPGAQVYCAAASREQAGIVYREASAMAKASPLLKDYIVPSDSVKNLAIPSANAFLRVISSESYTAEGLNIHGLIFDELHAQKTRDLYDALRYGGAARRQPLQINITTAGWDRHSICYELHLRAQKILAGELHDDSFFPYIRAAGDDDDWKDPKVWRKANPSMGVTIDAESFRQDFQEALESPTKENSFKRYRLDIWTEQDIRWISMETWAACADPVDPVALRGRECYAGLDLAATVDVAALALVFPLDDGRYAVLPFFWVPEEGARERERRDRVPYLTWARQGLVEITPGNVVDYDRIRARINELAADYRIREIAVDPWNAAHIMTQLQGDGLHVEQFRQGFASMSGPTKEFEKLVLGRQLLHGGNPVLRWMAGNVTVETDAAGNLKPSKKKSTEKIDGIVATIMALGRAMLRKGGSVYDTRGLKFL